RGAQAGHRGGNRRDRGGGAGLRDDRVRAVALLGDAGSGEGAGLRAGAAAAGPDREAGDGAEEEVRRPGAAERAGGQGGAGVAAGAGPQEGEEEGPAAAPVEGAGLTRARQRGARRGGSGPVPVVGPRLSATATRASPE